jgi:hypothetical protein
MALAARLPGRRRSRRKLPPEEATEPVDPAHRLAAVRNDLARRLELAARFYEPRRAIARYRHAEIAFMRWQSPAFSSKQGASRGEAAYVVLAKRASNAGRSSSPRTRAPSYPRERRLWPGTTPAGTHTNDPTSS